MNDWAEGREGKILHIMHWVHNIIDPSRILFHTSLSTVLHRMYRIDCQEIIPRNIFLEQATIRDETLL